MTMQTTDRTRTARPTRAAAPDETARRAPLATLERAVRVLLSPLDYPDWQTWQVDVHRHLLELTGSDTLCVFSPLAAGPAAWYSPHLDDAALAGYAAHAAADPEWDVIDRRFAAGGHAVAHEEELMPRAALESSPFYREFLLPNRIFDVVVASVPFGGPTPARLHFSWQARQSAATVAECRALVQTILPAFQSGLAVWRQLGERRAELARMLDALGDAVLLYDPAGVLVHANPAAARLLADGDAAQLRAAAQSTAWSVSAMSRRGGASAGAAGARTVRRGGRTHTLRGAPAPSGIVGGDAGVIVTIEVAVPRPLDDEALRARYGLTAREIGVARLVAEGLSNQEIADRLGVSFFTARNHVERTLTKLGAGSRARAGAILRDDGEGR